MKVLANTNILISALLWPGSKPAKALLDAARHHTLVLCDRNIFENPQKLIRDAKDQPILNAAIVADVDIILTGDKDFLSLKMERPRPMTVAEYLKQIKG